MDSEMAKTPVNRNMNPVSVKILETLGPDWMTYEDLMDRVGPTVPGEMAWRVAERQRGIPYRRAGVETPPRKRNDNPTAIILIGQRTVVRRYLQELKRTGRIEVEYEKLTVYMRPVRVRLSAAELELRDARS